MSQILVPELDGCINPAEVEIGFVNLHTRCEDPRCPAVAHLTDFGTVIVFVADGVRLARTFSIEETQALIEKIQRQLEFAKAARLGLIANGEGDA